MPKGPPPTPWSAGLGVVHLKRAYRGAGDRAIPIPFVSYRGKNFFFQGPRAGAQIPLHHFLAIGLQGRYHFAGYDPVDSSFLSGMKERKDALELGGLLQIRFRTRVSVDIDYYRDATNRHQGQEWDISLRRPFRMKPWTIIPSIGVGFISTNKSDYYYGVEREEAATARPVYEVPATTEWEGGLTTLFQFSKAWHLMISFSFKRLDSDVEKSPIVARRATVRTLAGLSTEF